MSTQMREEHQYLTTIAAAVLSILPLSDADDRLSFCITLVFTIAAEISSANKCLLSEFDSHLSNTVFLTERHDSTARSAQDSELDDVIGALEHVNSANVLKNKRFVAADLNQPVGVR